MQAKEKRSIERKLMYALGYLSSLFEYEGRLEFMVDSGAVTKDLVRVMVTKNNCLVLDFPIERSTMYKDAGTFVGNVLHRLVNPMMYPNNGERVKVILRCLSSGGGLNEILTKRSEDGIIRRFVVQACGKAVADSKKEKDSVTGDIQEDEEEEQITKYLRENDTILWEAYKIRKEGLIVDLARLSGREGRIKIIEICGRDILPGQEQ